jgi:hypothetical protein
MVFFSKRCIAKSMSLCEAFIHIGRSTDVAQSGDKSLVSIAESGLRRDNIITVSMANNMCNCAKSVTTQGVWQQGDDICIS